MRHLLLLPFVLFGYFTDAFAYCDTHRKFGGNLGYNLDTTLQLPPSTTDMVQNRCFERSILGRQFDSPEQQRNVQIEFANTLERQNQRPFEALPLERGKLSLKIQGDGYTVRFRRRSVIVTWEF